MVINTDIIRNPVGAMKADELLAWLMERHRQLTAHSRFVEHSLKRRAARGIHTRTDREFRRFQVLAADLLELVEGVIENIEQQQQAQEGTGKHQSEGAGRPEKSIPKGVLPWEKSVPEA